jgi:hypothetical protein
MLSEDHDDHEGIYKEFFAGLVSFAIIVMMSVAACRERHHHGQWRSVCNAVKQ